MGFTLDFVEKGEDIVIKLPKQDAEKAWALAKQIVDMYFERPTTPSDKFLEENKQP